MVLTFRGVVLVVACLLTGLSHGVAADDSTPVTGVGPVEELLDRAKKREQSGDFDSALVLYRSAANQAPDFYDAVTGFARNANKTGDYEAARTAAAAAITIRSDIEAQWEYARALAGLDSTQKAVNLLTSLFNHHPDYLPAQTLLGRLLHKQKDYDRAASLLAAAWEKSPSAPLALQLGSVRFDQKKFEDAIELFERALELNVDFHKARLALARALFHKAHYRDAVALFDMAIPLTQSQPVHHYERITAKFHIGDSAAAYRSIDDMITRFDTATDTEVLRARFLAGNHLLAANDAATALNHFLFIARADSLANIIPNVHLHVADAYAALSKPDSAAMSLRRALAADSTHLEACLRLITYYRKKGDLQQASQLEKHGMTILEKSIADGETGFSNHRLLGTLYARQGRHADAVAHFQEALKDSADHGDILRALGKSRAALQDNDGAIMTFTKVIVMNPRDTMVHKYLGDLYTRVNRPDDAMEAYRAYLALHPGDAAVAEKVGKHALGAGDYETAVGNLERVKDTYGTNPAFLLDLAEAYMKRHSYGKARDILEPLAANTSQKVKRTTMLRLLAQTYHATGLNAKAAARYAEYTALPGVRDKDASYFSAYLLEKSNPDKARRRYRTNISLFPDDYRNYLRLGLLLSLAMDDSQTVQRLFDTVARFARTNPEIRRELAAIHREQNNNEAELKALLAYSESGAGAAPDSINRRIGMLHATLGRHTSALPLLTSVLESHPDDVEIMLAAARCHTAAGDKEKAIALIERAQSLAASATASISVQAMKEEIDGMMKELREGER